MSSEDFDNISKLCGDDVSQKSFLISETIRLIKSLEYFDNDFGSFIIDGIKNRDIDSLERMQNDIFDNM